MGHQVSRAMHEDGCREGLGRQAIVIRGWGGDQWRAEVLALRTMDMQGQGGYNQRKN